MICKLYFNFLVLMYIFGLKNNFEIKISMF